MTPAPQAATTAKDPRIPAEAHPFGAFALRLVLGGHTSPPPALRTRGSV